MRARIVHKHIITLACYCNFLWLSHGFNRHPFIAHRIIRTSILQLDASKKNKNRSKNKKKNGSINSSSLSSSSKQKTATVEKDLEIESTTTATATVNAPEKSSKHQPFGTYSARFIEDNGLEIATDAEGHVTARPKVVEPKQDETSTATTTTTETEKVVREDTKVAKNTVPPKTDVKAIISTQQQNTRPSVKEQSATVVPMSGFNVVLTHCTADFDSLAGAVGLAKLWSSKHESSTTGSSHDKDTNKNNKIGDSEADDEFDSSSDLPTFVVLPRGAHPSVQRFLALHKHLFPIRSLKSLPKNLNGLNRLGLVDAQRRDRIGPAENLLDVAKRITVVDHHVDSDTDIDTTDYVLDSVGSCSTLIVERLMEAHLEDGLTEAEATLLALGIHADTGSLTYDSTTTRDAIALAWVMEQGASQAAIAENAKASLSLEQQGVLTNALINTNTTNVHGVTVSSTLLAADGFINGLATVTQDALELSSSDVYLLGLVYEAKPGGARRRKSKNKKQDGENKPIASRALQPQDDIPGAVVDSLDSDGFSAEGWKGGEEALLRQRLKTAFDRKDLDQSGFLDRNEVAATLAASGIIASEAALTKVMTTMDTNGDDKIDFEEFVAFAKDAKRKQKEASAQRPCTLIIIGRVKAGVNMKSVKLGKLLERFGGGGHAKAASATVRLNDESEAEGILSGLVDELIETSLQAQPTVGDFMTAPVLSIRSDMTEKQVEDLFTRYDVRALPVVDHNNDVIGLVTYKEVAAAKQRLWNKEQKRLRQEQAAAKKARESGKQMTKEEEEKAKMISEERRKRGSSVKAWMKEHVQTVEFSRTMAEVEAVLLENDVGCIPVVADGTKQLLGMVTRTDLLRQHRYYPSLHYHNKGFSDSIAARKPIIELRKKLKKFDLDE